VPDRLAAAHAKCIGLLFSTPLWKIASMPLTKGYK
jgi:hypothetical protein